MSYLARILKFNNESPIRVVIKDGVHWFAVTDILEACKTATKMDDVKKSILQTFGDGGVDSLPIKDTIGRVQETTVTPEYGVTYLLSRSETELGRKINRWLHMEVLPSIRKYGYYATNPQLNYVALERNEYYQARFESIEKSKLAKSTKNALTEHLTKELNTENLNCEQNQCLWHNGAIIADFVAIIEELERECLVGGWNVQRVEKKEPKTGIVRHYLAVVLMQTSGGVWGKVVERYPKIDYSYWNITEYTQMIGGCLEKVKFDATRESHLMKLKDAVLIPTHVDYTDCVLSTLKPENREQLLFESATQQPAIKEALVDVARKTTTKPPTPLQVETPKTFDYQAALEEARRKNPKWRTPPSV